MKLKKRAIGAVGRIEEYAAAIPPKNTIKANGAELSRVLFWRLFKHAQESGNLVDQASKDKGHFGTGDGLTTFTIPDRRGVVGRGFDDGAGLDSAPTLGRYQGDNNRHHGHGMDAAGHHAHHTTFYVANGGGGTIPVGFSSVGGAFNVGTSGAGSHAHPVHGSGAPEATMKNVSLLYCIRYQ
ncbi:hypothetical protein [Marinomonas foliarum]|uniref:Tail protein n=2 Tax=root TaxID=1 RepID=A0A899ISM6_9VIRU|nr:hypothetical protein [Marinomonas foliarum]QRV22800.1 hypothetical protein JSY38_12050 [Marinomonas foliarum]QSM01477.1 tail protein [Marinomonas phage MfV]